MPQQHNPHMFRVGLDHVKLRGIQLFRERADPAGISPEGLIAVCDRGQFRKMIRVFGVIQCDHVLKRRFENIVAAAFHRDKRIRGG